ncbi:MAG: hypothetical protein R3F65_14405 [bacterium]
MRLFGRVSAFVFALFFLAACGEEGEAPVTASSDPTPAQVSQALSDPAFIEATEMLAGDGLAVDAAAGHVISDPAGNWALEMPVGRLFTGGVVPYEALVYEVMEGVGGVYFIEAADGGAFEAAEGVEPVASEEPRLGRVMLNVVVCEPGPWTPWMADGPQEWWCGPTIHCPFRTLLHKEYRARWCRHPGGYMERQYQYRKVFQRCGC